MSNINTKFVFTLMMVPQLVFAAPTVTNGSFESYTGGWVNPAVSNVIEQVALAGWVAGEDRSDLYQTPGYNASSGSYSYRLHPNGTDTGKMFITQQVGGFTIGRKYQLTLDVAASAIWNYGDWHNISTTPSIAVTLGNMAPVALKLPVFDAAAAVFGQNPFQYQKFSLDFIADSEAMTLKIALGEPIGLDGGVSIDNVAIAEVSTSALALKGKVSESKKFTVTCVNKTTGATIAKSFKGTKDWDCSKMGVPFMPGDKFSATIEGGFN